MCGCVWMCGCVDVCVVWMYVCLYAPPLSKLHFTSETSTNPDSFRDEGSFESGRSPVI